jgi:hypothetical protein
MTRSGKVNSRQAGTCPKAAGRLYDRYIDAIGAMMKPIHVLPVLLATLLLQTVHADPIYKSVDSAGNVTYSSTPPEGVKAEKVDVPPPPSEEETRQAKERMKQAEEQASEMENTRLEQQAREQARADEEARQREAQQPVVIQQPVYIPQQGYYPPIQGRPPLPRPPAPPVRPVNPVPR